MSDVEVKEEVAFEFKKMPYVQKLIKPLKSKDGQILKEELNWNNELTAEVMYDLPASFLEICMSGGKGLKMGEFKELISHMTGEAPSIIKKLGPGDFLEAQALSLNFLMGGLQTI